MISYLRPMRTVLNSRVLRAGILIGLSALVLGCQSKKTTPLPITPYSGDYPVLKLRQMWAVCAQTWKQKSPFTHPYVVSRMCDCYVDKMRATYLLEEIEKLSDNESKAMGQILIEACNPKQEPIAI